MTASLLTSFKRMTVTGINVLRKFSKVEKFSLVIFSLNHYNGECSIYQSKQLTDRDRLKLILMNFHQYTDKDLSEFN